MPAPGLLATLKQETASSHEALERALDLLRPDLTLADYTALLERFWGFYEPWERAAAPSGLLSGREKTPLLRADLVYLGSDTARLPRCPELPPTRTAAEIVGAMYVLEGSTLGGQILSRHFERHLGVRTGEGASFFNGYADRTGSMWRSFREIAERNGDPEASIDPARQTFRILHQWLTERRA